MLDDDISEYEWGDNGMPVLKEKYSASSYSEKRKESIGIKDSEIVLSESIEWNNQKEEFYYDHRTAASSEDEYNVDEEELIKMIDFLSESTTSCNAELTAVIDEVIR